MIAAARLAPDSPAKSACGAAFRGALRNVRSTGEVVFTPAAMAGFLLEDCGGITSMALGVALSFVDEQPWFETVIERLHVVAEEERG